jgi:hypothetical protein
MILTGFFAKWSSLVRQETELNDGIQEQQMDLVREKGFHTSFEPRSERGASFSLDVYQRDVGRAPGGFPDHGPRQIKRTYYDVSHGHQGRNHRSESPPIG